MKREIQMILNSPLALPHRWSTLRPFAVSPTKKTARTRSPLTMPACTSDRYAHLRQPRPYELPAIEAPRVTRPRSADLATRILEAAAKAKRPTGDDLPPLKGDTLASQIVLAGQKRRAATGNGEFA
jgi:hypothetical protein